MYTTLKPARTDYTLYGYERTDYPDADNAVVYRRDYTATHDTRKPERYSVVAYAGKRNKPDLNFLYTDRDARERRINDWLDGIRADIARKAENNRRRRLSICLLSVGDILNYSWGYGQTNQEYYQVVEIVSPKTVRIRRIKSRSVRPASDMSDYVEPVKDAFREDEPILTKRVFHGNEVKFNFGHGTLWDGKPTSQTHTHTHTPTTTGELTMPRTNANLRYLRAAVQHIMTLAAPGYFVDATLERKDNTAYIYRVTVRRPNGSEVHTLGTFNESRKALAGILAAIPFKAEAEAVTRPPKAANAVYVSDYWDAQLLKRYLLAANYTGYTEIHTPTETQPWRRMVAIKEVIPTDRWHELARQVSVNITFSDYLLELVTLRTR